MRKVTKVGLGLLTLWPPLWMALFIVFFFGIFFIAGESKAPAGHSFGFPVAIILFFCLHAFTMLLMFALTAFFIIYLFRTKRIPEDRKVLWAIVLFMGGIVATPIFWYLYIWKDPESETAI